MSNNTFMSTKGFGKYSEPIRVRTKEGIPIRAPLNFIANPSNSTCIEMVWSAPPAQFVNGIIQGYKLVYQEKVNFTRRTHLIGAHLLRQQARTQRYLMAPQSLWLLRLGSMSITHVFSRIVTYKRHKKRKMF